MKKPRSYFVYKIVEGDELIYVGCSSSPEYRKSKHVRNGVCSSLAKIVVVKEFADRNQALRAERSLITELQPPKNITYGARDRRNPKNPNAMPSDQAKQVWLSGGDLSHRQVVRDMPGWTVNMARYRFGSRPIEEEEIWPES